MTASKSSQTDASFAVPTPEGRWDGIVRTYNQKDVERLRGSVLIEYTLASRGARRLWGMLKSHDFVAALGCLSGGQAVECAKAGLKAIYVSGW
ncbi:MAG: isocitrate lyase, partial [Patescibacteria group bacterium]